MENKLFKFTPLFKDGLAEAPPVAYNGDDFDSIDAEIQEWMEDAPVGATLTIERISS